MKSFKIRFIKVDLLSAGSWNIQLQGSIEVALAPPQIVSTTHE